MRAADRPLRESLPTREDERGSVTLFVVIAVLALFLMTGLVVDGGAKLRAAQRASAVAEEAARAGGQAVSAPSAIRGQRLAVDPRRAEAAAQSYLADSGATGTVHIVNAGDTLVVNVTTQHQPVFLGAIGISSMTVRGQASARLVRGISAAESE